MSRTNTHQPGRLRALAVASALTVSLIAGAAAPALADHDDVPPGHASGPSELAPGLDMHVDARSDAAHAPWNDGDGGGATTQGWSWF